MGRNRSLGRSTERWQCVLVALVTSVLALGIAFPRTVLAADGAQTDIGHFNVSLDQTDFTYDGTAREPGVFFEEQETTRSQLAGVLFSVADLNDDGQLNGSVYQADAAALAYFADVTNATPCQQGILYLAANGIDLGWEDEGVRFFYPSQAPTRYELALDMYRQADLLDDGVMNDSLDCGETIAFADIPSDDLQQSAVASWLANRGIDDGFEVDGNREFRGDALLDEEQLGLMLAAYCSNVLQLSVPEDGAQCLAYLGYGPVPGEGDYIVTYESNIDAGTAKAIITGCGSYTGSIEKSFSISKALLRATYVGETIAADGSPELKVTVEGFVNGETAETAAGYVAPTVILPDPFEPAKTYALAPGGGSADNYEFEYVAGNLVVEAPEMFFLDITYGDEVNHASDVEWMGVTGISTGWEVSGGREYRGTQNIKRCDMAAFLYRLAGCPDFSTTRGFKDVTVSTPHYREIAWLAESGISRGWADNTFRPMANVARQDMAAFLYRFADLMDDGAMNQSPALGSEIVVFSDVRHGDTVNHSAEIEWLASVGVTRGWAMGNNTYEFRGFANAKRQDMAAFLHRLTVNVLSSNGEEYVPTTTTNSVTVTFTDGLGRLLKVQTVAPGSDITPPANPTRTGYTFAGWDREYANPTVDIVVNARWNINRYTVTFTDGLGTVLKTQTVNYGSAATAPANPTRTGYTFAGWDRSFSNVTGNITVNAKWAIKTFTVRFTDGYGTTLKTQNVAYGGSATAPATPSRYGYIFNGWDRGYTNVTSNITVNATWVAGGGGMTVYITNSGKKYHRDGCSSLSHSKIPITLSDAVAQGYGPCKNCNPPTL